MELAEAVDLAFIDLEESYHCKWRAGLKEVKEAFSQRDIPPYKYLGYKGGDGLRHFFGRSILSNIDKLPTEKWEDWILKRINLYYCKNCKKVHDRLDKTENKCVIEDKKNIRNKEIRNYVSNYICNFLSTHPCEICGETDIRVLEFDHINPIEKLFDIGNRSSRQLDVVQKEISKCRVLCSNCHKKHTAKEQNHFKSKYLYNKTI